MPARSLKPARAASGFTLLELMVAVVVFVILATLAIPGFTTYMEKARVRGAADDVVSALAQARQVAVKYDRNVSLKTTGSGATWCLGAREAADPLPGNQAAAATACDCSVSNGDACVIDTNHKLVVSSTTHDGVTLASPAGELSFDGRLGIRSDTNNANDSSFDLVSKTGRYSLTIAVSPLGQASVCSNNGAILGYPAC